MAAERKDGDQGQGKTAAWHYGSSSEVSISVSGLCSAGLGVAGSLPSDLGAFPGDAAGFPPCGAFWDDGSASELGENRVC